MKVEPPTVITLMIVSDVVLVVSAPAYVVPEGASPPGSRPAAKVAPAAPVQPRTCVLFASYVPHGTPARDGNPRSPQLEPLSWPMVAVRAAEVALTT